MNKRPAQVPAHYGSQWIRQRILSVLDLKELDDVQLLHVSPTQPCSKAGCLSHIIAVRLTWDKPHLDLPDSVVLKLPTGDNVRDDEKHLVLPWLSAAHAAECNFYRIFANTEHQVCVPRVYAMEALDLNQARGVILMECLTGAAAHAPSGPRLRLEQVRSVVRSIAKLHAVSIRNQEATGWVQRMQVDRPAYATILGYVQPLYAAFARARPDLVKSHIERLPGFVQRWLTHDSGATEAVQYMIESPKALGHRPVICHGDLDALNILFHLDSNGQTAGDTVRCFIDWQFAYPGALCDDIVAFLMAIAMNATDRRAHTEELLELYLEHVNMCLSAEQQVSMNEVHMAYRRALPLGVLMWFTRTQFLIANNRLEQHVVEQCYEQLQAYIEDYVHECT